MLTLMSGLLILTSCFSPVLAAKTGYKSDYNDYNNETSYVINLDKIASHTVGTAKGMIIWGAGSFGLAFIPTGTSIFAIGTTFILLGNELAKAGYMSETERSWRDLETTLVIGAGVAGHAAGWYCLIKLAQAALEAVK